MGRAKRFFEKLKAKSHDATDSVALRRTLADGVRRSGSKPSLCPIYNIYLLLI